MSENEDLEKRVALLEMKLQLAEERRRKVLGDSLDDPFIQQVLNEAFKSYAAHLQFVSEQGKYGVDETRFLLLKEKKLYELEQARAAAEQRELAEVSACIEFYEKYGVAPEGYDIVE
jgi:hypothetical protein